MVTVQGNSATAAEDVKVTVWSFCFYSYPYFLFISIAVCVLVLLVEGKKCVAGKILRISYLGALLLFCYYHAMERYYFYGFIITIIY